MIRKALFFFIFLAPVVVYSHPPVALVMDSRGTVFYSDLSSVWMIMPDGTKSIAVADVHTHELWLDPDDVLYGEDVRNVGERYRHRVWKRFPDGRMADEIPWRAGHPVDHHDYAFVRDGEGRSYVLRKDERAIDVRMSGRLLRSIPLTGATGYLHWHTVTEDGTIFFTAGSHLYRIDAGGDEFEVVGRDLVERTEAFDFVHDRHALMGMWTDADRAVYVSVYTGQMVKRIDSRGKISVVYRAAGNWSVSGGMSEDDGSIWLLEFSSSNQVRVRRLGADGKEQTY